MYQTGLQIVQDHPLLGVGGNDLKSLAKSYMSDDYSMKNSLFSDNFHDIFIQTAVQGGLIQLVVLLCAMAIPILHSISALLKRKLPLGFGYLLSIALSLLAINLVESELYMARNFSAFSFWLVLGWGLALCPPLEESKLLGLQKKLMPWTRKKS